MPVTREKVEGRSGRSFTIYRNEKQDRFHLSVHESSCIVDFGQELRFVDRTNAAKILRRMRRDERIGIYDYPTYL